MKPILELYRPFPTIGYIKIFMPTIKNGETVYPVAIDSLPTMFKMTNDGWYPIVKEIFIDSILRKFIDIHIRSIESLNRFH